MKDVAFVSLGSTYGLQAADAELVASLQRAGASVSVVHVPAPRRVRTFMLTDLVWARAARRAMRDAPATRATLYSTTTAALLWRRPGAIRFDAPARANRPGRHGVWQRPVEARRLSESPLLVPWAPGALEEAGSPATPSVVVPVPVAPSGPAVERDVAAVTYATNPLKKGFDRVVAAWGRAARPDEELVVAGIDRMLAEAVAGGALPSNVRVTGRLEPAEYRALLRRARLYVTAPRREDFGIAQLEALADGCRLVTTPSPGPYAALPLAHELEPRFVTDDLAAAVRVALDEPLAEYADRAAQLVRPYRPEAVDRVVAEELMPALLRAS